MDIRLCSRTGRTRLAENCLLAGLHRYFSKAQLKKLQEIRVGIAGAGGLGSNAAILLCRTGIGSLFLIDDDVVEASNLNRQCYMPDQLGRAKVDALGETLLELNPDLELVLLKEKLDNENVREVVKQASLWVEALDAPQAKTLLVENALLAGCKVASASGLCGFGGPPLGKRKLGNLVLVGDFTTSCEMAPPLAPRVTQAAALLCDSILEFVLA